MMADFITIVFLVIWCVFGGFYIGYNLAAHKYCEEMGGVYVNSGCYKIEEIK